MQEQEPTVNDILSSIRQILSNKIEDGSGEVASSDTGNEAVENVVDEQEQALMQATDVYVLMPDMRVAQGGGDTDCVSSAQIVSSNDMPYEQPMSFDEKKNYPIGFCVRITDEISNAGNVGYAGSSRSRY